jgi:hypothetical protein
VLDAVTEDVKKDKGLTPVHYVTRRMRIKCRTFRGGSNIWVYSHLQHEEEELYRFFREKGIKAVSEKDKQAVYRQIGTAFQLQSLSEGFLRQLIEFHPEVDMIKDKDSKGNCLAHYSDKFYFNDYFKDGTFGEMDGTPMQERYFSYWYAAFSKQESGDAFVKEFTRLLQEPNDAGLTPMLKALKSTNIERN